MRIVKVVGTRFTAAFVSSGSGENDGRVIAAHPAVAFLLGKPDHTARAILKHNGWKGRVTTDPAVGATCTMAEPPPTPLGEQRCWCGKSAPFGVGVALLKGQMGTWFCREHAPMFRPLTGRMAAQEEA
jgi:hypothetical protein